MITCKLGREREREREEEERLNLLGDDEPETIHLLHLSSMDVDIYLPWSSHISTLVKKAQKRLYC